MHLPLRSRAVSRGHGRGNGSRQLRCTVVASSSQSIDAGMPQLVRLQPEILAEGGLNLAEQPLPGQQSFASLLQSNFLPVRVTYPGIHILNIDPPVLTVKNFLSDEDCDAFIRAATDSGNLKSSRVGGQGVSDKPDIRTSSTLAMTQDVLASHPELGVRLHDLLQKAVDLLGLPPELAEQRKLFTRPSPGQLTFELPQIAHYMPGEHFLSHEDAFPVNTALEKGYQRRATLLVYLNDVAEGGATHFDYLDMGVQPTRGTALLFFPSFAGGRPDARTLHTATDAVDEKWMTQLWVSGGLRQKAAPASVSASNLPAMAFDPTAKKTKRKKKAKK